MKLVKALLLVTLFSSAASAQNLNFTAKLFTASGQVEVMRKGATAWTPVTPPFFLDSGDRLKTGKDGKAEIYVRYGAKLRLGTSAVFSLDQVGASETAVQMLRGRLSAWIRKSNRRFSVRTPASVCAVRGTVFDVEVEESGKATWSLFSGSVLVTDNKNNGVVLVPGQRVAVTKTAGVQTPAPIPAAVKPPEEPVKIKEEIADIAAEVAAIEKARADAKAREEAKKAVPLPVKEDLALPPPPLPSVIPTQEVQESLEVSGSTP